MLYLDVLASPLVAGCLLRASQAEDAGREMLQVTLVVGRDGRLPS